MKQFLANNRPFIATEEEVEKLFSQYAGADKHKPIRDPQTGEKRGISFVEDERDSHAVAAIEAVAGHDVRIGSIPVETVEDDDDDE